MVKDSSGVPRAIKGGLVRWKESFEAKLSHGAPSVVPV